MPAKITHYAESAQSIAGMARSYDLNKVIN